MNIAKSNEPLAQRITLFIKESGLKQIAVAEKAGYSAQEFNDMLNGRKLIRVCDIPKIAYGLGVSANKLFERE